MGPLKDSRSSMLPRGWSKALPGPPSFPAHLLVSPLFSLIFHFPFLTPLLIFHHLSPLPDCRMVILHFLQPAAAPTFSAVLTVQQKKTSSSLPKQLIESLEILCICTHEKREFLPYCFFPGLNLLPSPGQEAKVCSVPRTVLHSKDG